MVFYIVYKASKEFKNRSLISKRLKTLGCKRICSSFWEVNSQKINEVLKIVSENQPILLRRTREIRKPIYDDEGNIGDFGSLVVITYNAERDDKSKIKGLLMKTPYIRLCRSVYAFRQNNHKYDGRGDLFNLSRLFMLIKENDREAKIFSRMVIVNNAETTRLLVERVRLRVEKKIEGVLNGYKNLLQMVSQGQIDKKRLAEEEKRLYGDFVTLRKIAIFYERWLKMGFAKDLVKVYSIIRKLQSLKMEKGRDIYNVNKFPGRTT